MLEKETLDSGLVRVAFRVSKHIWAESIALVGEFNAWDTQSHLLCQTHSDGEWHISLELEPHRAYRFRYLVNGQDWMDDDHADGYEPNPYGGFDSIVYT